MIDIITTETRKLTDHEFAFLRMHPQLGANMLSGNPVFLPYQDVVLGHHRTYDGKGGYPKSFQNTESPKPHEKLKNLTEKQRDLFLIPIRNIFYL